MNKWLLLLILIMSFISNVSLAEEETPIEVNEARSLIKQFGGKLKLRLKAAIEEGGLENAIEVCNVAAPDIARNLSNQSHWQIGRTSLKLRNPNNAADPWETEVLEQFEQRLQNGEAIKQLDYYENTSQGFRYMKAIPTQGLCLSCHGESIPASVQAKLNEFYPIDKAINYKAGQIRGAFTLIKSEKTDL